jgi:hypothetical protein
MIKYIIHDSDGNIISCGLMSEETDQRLNSDHTQVLTDFPDDIENYRYDLTTGSLVRFDQSISTQRETDEAWAILRVSRASMLANSDWTQANDAPLTEEQKQSWRTYRQALRDLPANTVDPSSPVFPDAPS